MRLLLDMCMAPRMAQFLRELGHDAVHLREQDQGRLPDEDVMTKAAREGRALVTFDLDFGEMVSRKTRI